MILVGRRLDADELRRLLEDPSFAQELIEDDDKPTALDIDKA